MSHSLVSAPAILIVAQSGRIFAQSAVRAGLGCYVVDCFADEDTRHYAERFAQVDAMTVATVLAACARVAARPQDVAVVFGSGIDSEPEIVTALQSRYLLAGNGPGILSLVNDPRQFFACLDRLAISHPETVFLPPADPAGWLVKAACGEGGKRVAFTANFELPGPDFHYFQRLIHGTPCSLLFLADGRSIQPIGFNTQLTTSFATQPFLFAGAINRAELSAEQRQAALFAAKRLTEAVGLKGLNSLDFIATQADIQVLEVNPRPGATAQLYDDCFTHGWLSGHLQACRGQLPPAVFEPQVIRGFRTVFAETDTCIDSLVDWPKHCHDRPVAGSNIKANEPLCTVQAEASGYDQLQTALSLRETEIRALLGALPPATAPATTSPSQTAHQGVI